MAKKTKEPRLAKLKSLTARFLGPAVLVSAAVVAAGGACLAVAEYQDGRTAEALDVRAPEMLRGKGLTVTAVEKFRRDADCGDDRPYGANFTAPGADKGANISEGHICWAPGRESLVYFRQRQEF